MPELPILAVPAFMSASGFAIGMRNWTMPFVLKLLIGVIVAAVLLFAVFAVGARGALDEMAVSASDWGTYFCLAAAGFTWTHLCWLWLGPKGNKKKDST